MESTLNKPRLNAPVLKTNVQPSPRVSKKSNTDEKKNLSKHHLILPNNTQICVETLLSQCTNEEQSDRKFDTKLRARLKKKKLTLFKPKNFILKNGRLRPIVTTNIKSGVFRSVEFANQKKKKNMRLVSSNVFYSQSTLPSCIQSLNDFCNDKWVEERTTQYMPNDWTRPVALNEHTSRSKEIHEGDFDKKLKPKDLQNRNEVKAVSVRNGYDTDRGNNTAIENVQKHTIHRLVTPDGFHLSTNPESNTKFSLQFLKTQFGSTKEFKQPMQQPFHSDKNHMHHNDKVETAETTPISRTRFSRATRSPLKYDAEFDALPMMDIQLNSNREESADDRFTDKVMPLKNSFGGKNRCRTCNKVYLGRRKVIRHLKAFPEHDMPIPPKPTRIVESKLRTRTPIPTTQPPCERLFDFLIQKIKSAPIDEKSHILFREISDFVEKLEAIRSQLLCDDNTHSSVEYLDKHCSKIFGTQEGNYHISLDILEQLASGIDPNEFASNAAADSNILPNQIDHNINVSLSSISESKIHLVDGISEESLLKTVDDLMRKEGRMGDGNFDHIEISDNAVEAVTLKSSGTTQPILNLSLDLFKFDGT